MITHLKAKILGHQAIIANAARHEPQSQITVTVDWHPFVEHHHDFGILRANIAKVFVSGSIIVAGKQHEIEPIFVDNTDEWQFASTLQVSDSGRVSFDSAVVNFKKREVYLL